MKFISEESLEGYYYFWCSGCNETHYINTIKNNDVKGNWQFNNDINNPTVNPSILINVGGLNKTKPICHSFIKNGYIQFLNDCTHQLAGQTVQLPDIEYKEWVGIVIKNK